MKIVHQISNSTKKSELKNVEFCTTFCWFYWKCAKLSLKHLSSHLLLTNNFLKQGQFFSSVWQFYNLLTCCKNQNSKKCIFVPVAWVFVKHYKSQKMQKKVIRQFIFGCLSQKLMPWVHLLTFLSSDFFSEPEIWSSITT